MPEGTVLTAITAIVGTLAAVIGRLYLKSESRWEKALEDQRLANLAAVHAMQVMHDKTIENFREQIEIARTDTADYKRMLESAIRSGVTVSEVSIAQARALDRGVR